MNTTLAIELDEKVTEWLRAKSLQWIAALDSTPLTIVSSGTVITTKYGTENDAAPISTFSLVSHKPRIDSIAVHSARHTYRNLATTPRAVANFFFHDDNLPDRLYTLADKRFESGDEKIKAAGFTLDDSYTSGVKRISEADAWIEYEKISSFLPPESDREVSFLRLLLAYSRAGVLDPATGLVRNNLPIIRHLGCNLFRVDRSDNHFVGGTPYSMPQHRQHTFRK